MALNFPDSPTLNQVYTDSVSGFSYQWDGFAWQSYSPAASSNIRILDDISGSFDGTTASFALLDGGVAVTPANSQQIRVTLGGIVQEPTTDYVVAGSNVVFTTAPGSGLSCSIVSLGPALPVDAPNSGIIFARQEYNPTGVQTSFTFTNNYTSGYLEVYHNGVKLVDSADFTATNGSTFDLTVAAQNGDVVEAIAYLQTSLYTLGNYTNYLTVVNNATVGGILTATTAVVGSANTFTEDLVVNGDARITGILTIGTSSITLDGTNNEVNVGTGVTIHHTNGVQVGGNTVHSSGLTVNQLNVSGIVTASNVSVANSVTATTFYGSGANLSGIDATQIQTGNTSVQTVDTGSDGHVKITTEGTERWRVTDDGTLRSNSNDTVIQNNIYQNRSGVDILRTDTTQFYISDSGNDSTGDGSSSSPWRTLQKAFDNVPRLFAKTPVYIRILGSSYTQTGSSNLLGNSAGAGWHSYYSGEGIQIQADTGTVTFNLNDFGIGFESVKVPIRFKNINFLTTNGTSGYNGLLFQDCDCIIMYDSCTWQTGAQGSWSYYGGVRAYRCPFIQWNANVTLLSNATPGLGGLFIYNACTYVNHTCNMLKNGTRWSQAAIVAQNGTMLVHGGNLDNFHTGIRLGTNHYSAASGARCVLGNTNLYNLNIGVDVQYGSHLRSYYVPNIQNIGSSYNISGSSSQN